MSVAAAVDFDLEMLLLLSFLDNNFSRDFYIL